MSLFTDLKFLAYHALLPQYLEWSKNLPLAIAECQLRDKNWVELISRQPDIDAIADKFFVCKGKSKVKIFSAKGVPNFTYVFATRNMMQSLSILFSWMNKIGFRQVAMISLLPCLFDN